eukprot:12852884-Alexandrium_andersonii.AAC.1
MDVEHQGVDGSPVTAMESAPQSRRPSSSFTPLSRQASGPDDRDTAATTTTMEPDLLKAYEAD